jgi:hypothetical protein
VGVVGGDGSETAIFPDAGSVGILLRRLEDDGLQLELEVFDGLLDEVAVGLANLLELGRRNADVKRLARDVGEAGRLQPGVEPLTVHLFLERSKDSHPGVEYSCRSGDK